MVFVEYIVGDGICIRKGRVCICGICIIYEFILYMCFYFILYNY